MARSVPPRGPWTPIGFFSARFDLLPSEPTRSLKMWQSIPKGLDGGPRSRAPVHHSDFHRRNSQSSFTASIVGGMIRTRPWHAAAGNSAGPFVAQQIRTTAVMASPPSLSQDSLVRYKMQDTGKRRRGPIVAGGQNSIKRRTCSCLGPLFLPPFSTTTIPK